MLKVYALFDQICYDEIMKKLSLYIFLVLMCCNNSFAEDIADFQIEGISIGNSLLEYYSKKKYYEIQHMKKNKVTIKK